MTLTRNDSLGNNDSLENNETAPPIYNIGGAVVVLHYLLELLTCSS